MAEELILIMAVVWQGGMERRRVEVALVSDSE
jgi:hypothetical protein